MAADRKVLFLPHALHEMLRPNRMIRRAEVRQVVAEGEIVQDYLAVITAYLPNETEWSDDLRKRVMI